METTKKALRSKKTSGIAIQVRQHTQNATPKMITRRSEKDRFHATSDLRKMRDKLLEGIR